MDKIEYIYMVRRRKRDIEYIYIAMKVKRLVVGSISGQGAMISHASWPKKPKHNTETILWRIE